MGASADQALSRPATEFFQQELGAMTHSMNQSAGCLSIYKFLVQKKFNLVFL